ncbi:inner centromere protein-like isoform X2 [Erpetoichthys calabaricus]|uniref:inner centromere protein-like isoform X2 n=1 Tax=Erpetoichthys calabaricus TaxID=27687 RepID=UPI002234AD6D|nr:inner centromere protein-like isoform X2 [Erpetoichthys calabaricus]
MFVLFQRALPYLFLIINLKFQERQLRESLVLQKETLLSVAFSIIFLFLIGSLRRGTSRWLAPRKDGDDERLEKTTEKVQCSSPMAKISLHQSQASDTLMSKGFAPSIPTSLAYWFRMQVNTPMENFQKIQDEIRELRHQLEAKDKVIQEWKVMCTDLAACLSSSTPEEQEFKHDDHAIEREKKRKELEQKLIQLFENQQAAEAQLRDLKKERTNLLKMAYILSKQKKSLENQLKSSHQLKKGDRIITQKEMEDALHYISTLENERDQLQERLREEQEEKERRRRKKELHKESKSATEKRECQRGPSKKMAKDKKRHKPGILKRLIGKVLKCICFT